MSTFKELGLKPSILKALDQIGFETPTEIQLKSIPMLLQHSEDLIAFAQTGTGKTAAFSLPIIERAEAHSSDVQAIILCPTRELCLQISKDIESFAKYTDGVNVLAVYGGTSIEPQLKALKRGVQIVVGTPGRTLDLINRRKLRLHAVQYLVLDEADEMLSMGFKDDLDAILGNTPEGRQTLLFSATMPKGIKDIAKNYMRNPEQISAGNRKETTTNVTHSYYMVKAKDRYEALKRIADANPNIYGIVFCRTRRETKEVADKFMQDGYSADALHGDLSQAQRDHVMSKFRSKHLQMLIATDVAARGLDVNDLTHVINYNLPDATENYVHRSGRTGRAGKHGVSMTIIHSREKGKIRQLEKKVGRSFEKLQIPSGKEICEIQLFSLIDKIKNVAVDEEQIADFLPMIYEKLEDMSGEDLIKKIVSIEFNHFLKYYKGARDLNIGAEDGRGRDRDRGGRDRDRGGRDRDRGDRRSSDRDRGGRDRDRGDSRSSDRDRGGRDRDSRDRGDRRSSDREKFTRLYINIGSKSNLRVPELIGLINRYTKSDDIEIGKVDVMKKFTFFDIDKNEAETVIKAMNGKEYEDKIINVEITTSPPAGEGGRASGKSKYKGSRRSEGGSSDQRRSSGESSSRRSGDDKRRKNKYR